MRQLFLLTVLIALSVGAFAQSTPPITVQEIDGSPTVRTPTKILMPNGSLSITGKTVTFTPAGGDTVGAASATDNAIVRFDGTSGKVIQNSVVTIADTNGNMAGVGTFTAAATARTSGSASYFKVTAPADTTLAASTESVGVDFVGATREFATGALTTQREIVFRPPTYAFVGASTLATAATVAITAAPVAGTNATITTPLALWVQSGNSQFTPAGETQAAIRVNHSDGTPRMAFGVFPGATTFAGFWAGNITPSTTNYTFIGNGSTESIFNVASATGALYFRFAQATAPSAMTLDGNQGGGLGINTSTISAMLHAVSSSATRIGLRVDTAASPSVAIANFTNNGTSKMTVNNTGSILQAGIAHASLGTPTDGTLTYCTDCTVTSGADNTCAASGTGALAVRLNGVWRCFNAQN